MTARDPDDPPTAHGIALGAAAFLLFALTAPIGSDVILLGNDVVPYAVGLAAADRAVLFHPNHLFAHLAALFVLPLAKPFAAGPVTAALLAQVLVSAMGGAIATVAVWRAAHVVAGRAVAAVVALFFATACGNWLYGSVGETYLPAIAAVAWIWSDAIVAHVRGESPGTARLAVLAFVACGLRQDSVLALPALFLIVAPRRLAIALSIAGAAALVVYFAAWGLSRSPAGFIAWLRGVAESGLWGGAPDGEALAMAAVLTVGAHAWGVVAAALDIVNGRGLGLTALFAAAPLLVAAGASRWGRSADGGASLRAVALALVAFAAIRFAFYAWWQPTNLEYHTGTLVPLALLVAIGLTRGRALEPRLALVVVGVALGAIGNATLLIGPARGDEIARRADAVFERARPGGLVVALDRLQHYAHLRARDGEQRPELVDASDAVSPGADPAHLAALVARAEEALSSGRTVVLALDLVTADHIGMPPPPVAPAAAYALLSLGRGARPEPGGWLVVLEPRDGAD